jgi:DNA-binding transcriptional regulator YdaS (Cro superfamily)
MPTKSNEAIARACAYVDGQAKLAERLHVSPSAVNQWVNGTRPIPAIHCPEIEKLCDGTVCCEELNDKVDWAYVRSTKYPSNKKKARAQDPNARG